VALRHLTLPSVLALGPFVLALDGCGGAVTSPAAGVPSPAGPDAPGEAASLAPSAADAAGPAELLLPDQVPDLERGRCVAGLLAEEARAQVEELRRAETRDLLAARRAEARAREARDARAAALVQSAQAQAAAAAAPNDAATQRQARYAAGAAGTATDTWLRSVHGRNAAARAADEVAHSLGAAERFADLTASHATLFELEGSMVEGAEDASAVGGLGALTRASLAAAAEAHPELEWLYLDRFLRSYAAEATECAADG
jgi:hypothetical protein